MTDFNTEMVGLDPGTVDTIADAVALKMRGPDPRYTTPNRSILEPGGIVPKPAEAGAKFYGGTDLYTDAGESAAEIATNLYLAKMLVEVPNPKTGRPYTLASDRLVDVMIKSADRAIRLDGPAEIPATVDFGGHVKAVDLDRFITKGYREFRADVATKAMTSTGATAGDEWVPTFASAELWRDVHLATIVAPAIRRVTMPTNPYELPTQTGSVTWRYQSTENTAVTASSPATSKATLAAAKLMAEIDFSGEFTEDSIIPAIPALRADLVRSGAQMIDDLIVSGDTETGGTGNVNSDDAAPTAGTNYLALNGMRKFAIVTNTAQVSNVAAAMTSAAFTTIRGLLGKYGANSADLVAICGYSTATAMVTIAEVITPDKYGPGATVLRGELGRFFNVPILQVEAIPGASIDKVDADGKYTTTAPGTNDTKGWLLIVNRNGWTVGFRRELTIESFRDIQLDKNILVASFRQAQIPSGIATIHTAIGRNVTV